MNRSALLAAAPHPPHIPVTECLHALEPRYLFDAAGAAVAAEAAADSLAREQAEQAVDGSGTPPTGGVDADRELLEALASHAPPAARHEIAFVDPSVKDYETLLAGFDPQVEVVLLDPKSDGVEEISAALSHRQDLNAVHIFSHGSQGVLHLGATPLTLGSLLDNAHGIRGWRNAFTAEGDLLVYGCNLAGSAAGRALIDGLRDLTGADVAASEDPTGAAALGGDWTLEYRTGDIESELAFRALAQTDWMGLLAAPQIDLDPNNSAAAGGADYTAQYPVAGGALPITDIDAKLSDLDSPTLASLTVTLTSRPNGANESLSAVTTGTAITPSYNSGTGVLTLSGSDTVGHYQQVLRTITYQNTDPTPDRSDRVITFVANDGSGSSNTATATVSYWNNVRDDFSPANYTGNDGSVTWSGPWQELGENNGSGAGNVSADSSTRALQIGGTSGLNMDGLGAQRSVDLSSAASAILSVDWQRFGVTQGTSVALRISDNGGGSWTTLATYNGGLGGTSFAKDTFDISAYTTASTRIRFIGSGSLGLVALSGFRFDNIDISFDVHGIEPALDLDANNSSGANGSDYATSFTEGTAVRVTDGADASLMDGDSSTMTELVATIVNPLDGTAETLSANTTGTSITATFDSATATLTLSGADSVANYQQVLRTITYNNTSQSPNPSSRSITFAASDGVDHSHAALTTLTVTAVNDAPTVSSLAGDGLAYSEGSGPQLIEQGGNAVASDSDSTDFDSGRLTVSIMAGGDPTEDLLAVRDEGGGVGQISVSGSSVRYNFGAGPMEIGTFSGGSGGNDLVIDLNASATPEALTALIRNITYENTDAVAPTAGARTVRFTLNDGDGGTSPGYDATVTVYAGNAPPQLTGLTGDSLAYSEGDGPRAVEQGGNAAITDPDSADLDGGNLRASIAAGGDAAEDLLSIRDEGNGPGQIGFSGGNVTYGGVVIGTASGGSGGSDLVITFNASATPAAAAALIRNITYENTDTDDPSRGTRTLRFTVDDGDGATSSTHDTTVTVTAVNDPPIVSANAGLALNEGATGTITNALLAVSDVDNTAAQLTYTLSAIPANGMLRLSGIALVVGSTFTQDHINNNRLTYAHDGGETPSDSFSFTVSDGAGGNIGATTFGITVTPVNDAPVATLPGSYSATEQTVLTLHATGLSIGDVDAGGSVQATLTVSEGTLSAAPGTTGVAVAGSGTGTVTLTGTLGLINSLLAGAGGATLTYLNNLDAPSASVTLSLAIDDLGNTGSGGNRTDSATSIIDMTAVDDPPSITANTLTLSEGSTTTLSPAVVDAQDADHAPSQLTYTASNVSGGQFELAANPGIAITSFTQAQINANEVRFVHDGGEGAPSYVLILSDGTLSDGPQAGTIMFANINDAPVLAVNTGATVDPGGSVALTPSLLQATDTDNGSVQLTYTLSANPSNGRLEFVDTPGVAVASFTQADIDASRLRYVHSGLSGNDSFTFILSDGVGGTAVAGTFFISVNAPTAPPLLLDAPAERPSDEKEQSSRASERRDPTGGGALVATAATADETISMLGSSTVGDSAPRTKAAARGVSVGVLIPPAREQEAPRPAAPAPEQTVVKVLETTFSSHRYTKELDRLREDLQEALSLERLVIGSAVPVITGLSVGYVIWLVRGGVLLTSVLSSLPAWRLLDPLPVLPYLGKSEDEEEEDDESLESMLEEAAARERRGNLHRVKA